MEMKTVDLIPNVEWVSCANRLPQEGKFVWVVLGRVVEHGEAKRYVREVAMGSYLGGVGFQIFPYKLPICSNQVWAWASMVPPAPPWVKSIDHSNDEQYEGSEFDPDGDDEE
jgi:hypothetical protein